MTIRILRAVAMVVWVAALGGALLLALETSRLRDRVDTMNVATKDTAREAHELRESAQRLRQSVDDLQARLQADASAAPPATAPGH
jgi:FtsZ-binding cell division protein ZapB